MLTIFKFAAAALVALRLVSATAIAPALLPPSSDSLSQVTIDFSTQNTGTGGKCVNVGALAQVLDISCIQESKVISANIAATINEIQGIVGRIGLEDRLGSLAAMCGFKLALADHSFDTSSGSASLELPGLRRRLRDREEAQNIMNPFNPLVNVDWLQILSA
ncbi:hypothetical protein CALCODRAFT_487673 [Calocera cornea HHB12733]|uniref:Uncharacterized protein n=1 Tax=Calocera cornea HHB12733 TaxID=1353952 RepID=A0A165CZI2_9BASI|nr:hypothetical protein CALCODRAFT_487673 [Calocera cornea HHB12733]